MTEKLSITERKLRGTFQEGQSSKIVKGGKVIPVPDRTLNKEETEIYYQLANWCLDHDILQSGDCYQLGSLSFMLNQMYLLEDKIKHDSNMGVIEYGQGKGSNVSGYLIAWFKYKKEVDVACGKYGLDPPSRERLNSFTEEEDCTQDEWDKI